MTVASAFRAALAPLVLLLAATVVTCADPVAAPSAVQHESVTLLGAGDIATCSGAADSLTALLLEQDNATVFTAGDNLHDPTPGATYETCYGPSWGRAIDRTLAVMGNHDYDYDSGGRYFEYFGPRAGPPGLGYYSVDRGAWHIIALNSNATVVPTEVGSEQERWLREDLHASKARCTLALWHHPRFYHGSFNRNSLVRPFWSALWDARADVVVNGHFHLYERYAPQDADGAPSAKRGIRQFTVGTGGRGLDAFHQPAPNLEYRQNGSFGVLQLTLGDGWYDWKFIAVDRTVHDSGRAECHR